MRLVTFARRLLINCGKTLPFILCLIVMLAYVETIICLLFGMYVSYGDYVIVNTPINFYISKLHEYDLITIYITLILSVATETCKWNKIAICYLFLHLLFKTKVEDYEFEPNTIIILCLINILIATFLVYKGFKRIKFC